MNTERSVRARAALHAALGDPVRLAITDAVALGDVSPRELAAALGLGSNLLAHHIDVLAAAGLVARVRSEADRRRTYIRLLPQAFPFVHADHRAPSRIVFVCTQNSARSQLAAALLAARSGVAVTSAGTQPAATIHPKAVAVASRHGLDLRRARTRHVRSVVRPDDLVVSVCDRAYEETSHAVELHWSVPDPAAPNTAQAFAHTYDDLAERVERLAASITSEESA